MATAQRFTLIHWLEVGLVICWSSGFIGGTLAAATSSIYQVLFWRFVLASLVLAPLAMPQLRRLSLRQMGTQALIGALAMFGYLATVIAAIAQGVPPGTAALAGFVLSEPISQRQWVGLLIGFLGVAIAVAGAVNRAPL